MRVNKLIFSNRLIGLPVCTDGTAPTLTATYCQISVANMVGMQHYPRMGVGVIYETE